MGKTTETRRKCEMDLKAGESWKGLARDLCINAWHIPKGHKIAVEFAYKDKTHKYEFGPAEMSGPNDMHIQTKPGFDPTFRWIIPADMIVEYALEGIGKATIRTRYNRREGDEVPIVMSGRTRTTANRLANIIQKDLRLPTSNLHLTTESVDFGRTLWITQVENRRVKRDKDDEIALNLSIIEAMNMTDEDAAKRFGVSASTIRHWKNRAMGRDKKTEQTRPRSGLKRRETEAVLKALQESEYAGAYVAADAIRAVLTGRLPENADPWLVAAFKGAKVAPRG